MSEKVSKLVVNEKMNDLTLKEKEIIKYLQTKLSKILVDFSDIFLIIDNFYPYFEKILNPKDITKTINIARNSQNQLDMLLFKIESCLSGKQFRYVEVKKPRKEKENEYNININ